MYGKIVNGKQRKMDKLCLLVNLKLGLLCFSFIGETGESHEKFNLNIRISVDVTTK